MVGLQHRLRVVALTTGVILLIASMVSAREHTWNLHGTSNPLRSAYRIDGVNATDSITFGSERFLFDLPSSANVKVLVNKWGSDRYPSPLQSRDGEIRIEGTVVDSRDRPVAGRIVYFRVEDPPDTAPYVVANHDAHPGDNVDGPGWLAGGGRTAAATSGPYGRVSIVLRTTRFAAGDNYRVVASMEPDFDCAERCRRSAVYTAWKRVYLENDSMFRRGAFIEKAVPIGSSSIPVTDVGPFVERVGSRIILIHSGPWLFSTAYWMETHRIRAVIRDSEGLGGKILLGDDEGRTSVTKFSYESAPIIQGTVAPLLADGVGLVTGRVLDPRDDAERQDFLRVDDRSVRDLFAPAFVEYVEAPNAIPYVPFVEAFPRDDNMARGEFSEKWFENGGRPNRQHLIGASQDVDSDGSDQKHMAVATAEDGRSDVFIYVEAILQHLRTRDSEALLSEITAAEISHLWHVDPQVNPWRPEHDRESAWDRIRGKCQMAYTPLCPTGLCPEFVDGHLAFHYVKRPEGPDSEYLWIRQRCEPIPLEYPGLDVDWWTLNGGGCR